MVPTAQSETASPSASAIWKAAAMSVRRAAFLGTRVPTAKEPYVLMPATGTATAPHPASVHAVPATKAFHAPARSAPMAARVTDSAWPLAFAIVSMDGTVKAAVYLSARVAARVTVGV